MIKCTTIALFLHRTVRTDNPAGLSVRTVRCKNFIIRYCRFHLVCPGIKFGERNFFWAWYKLKLICVLYFHFVPSPEKVPHAKFFPERGGGQTKWNRQYNSALLFRLVPLAFREHSPLGLDFSFSRVDSKPTRATINDLN